MAAYSRIRVGHPLEEGVLLGPLHSAEAVQKFQDAVAEAKKLGGKVEVGGEVMDRPGYYVQPTIISGLPHDCELIQRETFAPIVYALRYSGGLDEAIAWNNEVHVCQVSEHLELYFLHVTCTGASGLVQQSVYARPWFCLPLARSQRLRLWHCKC